MQFVRSFAYCDFRSSRRSEPHQFRTIAHPTSDQLEACSDILPSLSNSDANSGNLAASDCKEGGKGRGGV